MTRTPRRVGLRAIVACVWVVGVCEIVSLASGDGDAYSTMVARTRGFGYLGLALLSAALCVSPLGRWLSERAKLRRALGLAAASAALVHVALAVSNSPLTLAEQLADPRLRFGVGAFAVLCLLAVTSFPRVVAWLRLRSWKELHRLAYIAWICALLHGLLSPYAWTIGLLAIAVVVPSVGVLRFVPKRDRSQGASQETNAD